MRSRVDISNGVVHSLVTDQKYTAVFAEFQVHVSTQTRTFRKGCKGCGNKRSRGTKQVTELVINYNGVKQTIANLPDRRKLKLKSMLGARQLRVQYKNGKGQVRTLLF